MSWLAGARARLRLLFDRDEAEDRMDDEFRFHLEMETERLVRDEGLDPLEARRRAFVAFGGVEKHKEELRDGRGLAWLGGMSLDFRLGLRLLLKYPMLTGVAGVAMAFAVWGGVVTFQLVSLYLNPTLPVPGGDRIVQIRNWDVAAFDEEPRVLHDYLAWRDGLRTVTDLGAYRDVMLNLITSDGTSTLVPAAEITESAFRIAPDGPLLGRTLVAADEEAGADPVVLLGYDVWRDRFGSDPGVVGQSVRIDDHVATIVGVMPDGFAFPIAHELWVPLRSAGLAQGPRLGPAITVFGRLADGASLESARAELTALGRRAAAESPDTHEHLQPQVGPYADQFVNATVTDRRLMMSIPLFAAMLMVLVCGNVALLLFARAATREGEIVVRTALGASRARILAQLFAEALVLSGVALVIGLAAARFSLLHWGVPFLEYNEGRMPFWYDLRISPGAVLYAIGLTVLGAAIAGVVPALKVTSGIADRLRQGTAGAGGLRFGRAWTAVIVTQVAFTVTLPAVAYVERGELVRMKSYDPGFDAARYVAGWLDMDPAPGGIDGEGLQAGQSARFVVALDALRQRVAAEPGVEGVAFVDRLPRLYHREADIQVDDSDGSAAHEVSIASVDPAYFDVLEAPVIAGRGFTPADLEPEARVAIVDQGFVSEVLRGQNPIGRRVRFAAETSDPMAPQQPGPWHEIVGMVPDLGVQHPAQRSRPAGLYFPMAPGRDGGAYMIVHTRGEPMELAPQLSTLAVATDPTLRLYDIQRLDRVSDDMLWFVGMWLRITLVLSAIALLLSLAGIYAVLSFTVARRTREIGVRVALGASRRRVVSAIFRRPLTQVAVGVVVGGALIGAVATLASGDGIMTGAGLTPRQLVMLVAYAALMFGVCLLACIVPTMRALRVEPAQALRTE